MRVLVTGSGGREHALAWKIAQSPAVEKVFVAPGNGGIGQDQGIECVDIDVMDFDLQIAFAQRNNVDLTVIGPEAPLVAGVVDKFNAAGLKCFGPGQASAQLEGSKSYTKDFLKKYNIPTAAYEVFEEPDAAIEFAKTMTLPVVIKADGLAAGKGVVLAQDMDEAEATIRDMLSGNVLGGAGSRLVIEEFLSGEEASFIVIADGERCLPFASSQDHKAAYDGDKGPNTGGMGAYSPAPVVSPELHDRIMAEVINPTLAGMKSEGHPYTGFLYAGLMIDEAGNPKVIEFNCRHGDPETQPIMMRLKTDLVELMQLALDGSLDKASIEFDERVALAVVMASGGYPGSYEKGKVITGIQDSESVKVFHAGTSMKDGTLVTSGGRVLAVTALGSSVSEAQRIAYEAAAQISFDDQMMRTDIGYRAVAREQQK